MPRARLRMRGAAATAATATLVTLAALASATAAPAQAPATVTVVATVPVPVPSGAGVRNLDFGSIVPGTSASVAPAFTAAAGLAAGQFAIDVTGQREIRFQLQVPDSLRSLTSSMPLSFNGSYGAYCVEDGATGCTAPLVLFNPDPTGAGTPQPQTICRSTNPGGQCTGRDRFPTGSQVQLLIGGQATAAASQPAGTYQATITLQILQVK